MWTQQKETDRMYSQLLPIKMRSEIRRWWKVSSFSLYTSWFFFFFFFTSWFFDSCTVTIHALLLLHKNTSEASGIKTTFLFSWFCGQDFDQDVGGTTHVCCVTGAPPGGWLLCLEIARTAVIDWGYGSGASVLALCRWLLVSSPPYSAGTGISTWLPPLCVVCLGWAGWNSESLLHIHFCLWV